jgi:hypothetical protein
VPQIYNAISFFVGLEDIICPTYIVENWIALFKSYLVRGFAS